MTKRINQANKKQTIIFRLCYKQEIAVKKQNSPKTENFEQNHTKTN